MGANTITISVQLGSGGFAIARTISDRLGFRYYDWEVTSQAAEEAGVSAEVVASAERVPSLDERIMERFFSAGFYAGDIPEAVVPTSATMDTAIQTLTSDNYRELMAAVVKDLAARGSSVIVGLASTTFPAASVPSATRLGRPWASSPVVDSSTSTVRFVVAMLFSLSICKSRRRIRVQNARRAATRSGIPYDQQL